MNYSYVIKHSDLFPSVIGVTYKQFKYLLPKFSFALRIAEHKKAYKKPRIREVGGGRKAHLGTDRQKLFFILLYYKVYPTFRFAQAIFELDKKNIQYWKEFLEPVLFDALGYQLQLPEVKVNGVTGLLTVCPALRNCIIDASERPIHRPKDLKKQQHYYSGKKKRHTVKNQIAINPYTKRILTVSLTVEGKMHDKRLSQTDPTLLRAPPKAKVLGDLGYKGAGEVNALISLVVPFKKPKGGKLTSAQKETNRGLSSIRVSVEHVLSYMKHFNILAHTFRNDLEKADQPFVNIACLYNFTRNYR